MLIQSGSDLLLTTTSDCTLRSFCVELAVTDTTGVVNHGYLVFLILLLGDINV